jgi:hypothetical protein
MPRPVAHTVGYVVHGLAFYLISSSIPREKKDSKNCNYFSGRRPSVKGRGEETTREIVSREMGVGA